MTDNGTLEGDKSCSDERHLVAHGAPAACVSHLETVQIQGPKSRAARKGEERGVEAQPKV